MALNNFANLKQAIKEWSKKTDISSILDDCIALAEDRIDDELYLRTNEIRATAATGTRFLELPTSFLQMRRLSVISGSNTFEIAFKTPEAMTIVSETGRPRYFTVTSQIEFDRVPDSSYTMEMSYYVRLSPLTTSNTTNDVLTRHPALYLYGALAEVYRNCRDEDMADYYDGIFDQKMSRANNQEKRGRYGPAPRMIYEGRTP